MRRARRHRRVPAVALAVAVAAAVPLLGGCGIRGTDVIEAGGPASIAAFVNPDYDMLIFFRSPDGGLSPVVRATIPSDAVFGTEYLVSGDVEDSGVTEGPVPTEKVVWSLLAGLQEKDRAAGLSTSLPAVRPGGTVKVASSGGRVTARLPLALEGLDSTALRQLTCTIAYSQGGDGAAVVELIGQDGASRSDTCGLAVGNTGNAPTATEPRVRLTPAGTPG
ncbi:hypothetical protein [Streptomyces flaveus]|uniref:hypothetical protein n=1 Tax=Streptomyces flaveus TaxID=66370 RepID=UPI00332C5C4A